MNLNEIRDYIITRTELLALVLLLTLAAIMSTSAFAGEFDRSWREPDLEKHFKVSAVIGTLGTIALEDPKKVFYGCMAVGTAKELYDATQVGNKFDLQDLTADAVGCASGVLLGDVGLKVLYKDDAVGINYSYPF